MEMDHLASPAVEIGSWIVKLGNTSYRSDFPEPVGKR